MRPTTFLRIASIITLLYFVGHTSAIPWTPDTGPEALSILGAMKGHSFEVIGSMRTLWDFYFGFGVAISLFLLMLAIVLWQLGSLAKTDALRVRPIVASLLIAFIVNAVLAWMYFFAIPLVMSIVISICLALAFVTAGQSKTN